MNAANVTYFDSFGVENVPKGIGKFIVNKKNIKKIFEEEDLIEILKILGLATNIGQYQKIYNHV